jgi:hypothetical protein
MNVHAAAVRMINRPQWFLMSLPIVLDYAILAALICVMFGRASSSEGLGGKGNLNVSGNVRS